MYSIIERTVIFNWYFNQVLNDTILNDIITSCNKIIFNNYEDLDTYLITNNKYIDKYHYKWKYSKFNQPLDNLPSDITNLTLGYYFNRPIDNLPSSIINLTLGNSFNQRLDNLPSEIINLTLGWYFNQPIDNLPSSIIVLTLGFHFNQRLDNLPSGIINLTLGYCFNQNLDNLPHGIINLTLGETFNQCLDNLPSTINKITFESYGYKNCKTKFNSEIKKIPTNLTLVDLSRIQNKSDLKKEFEKFNVEIIE
jgi:hypothetical protein